MAEYINRDAAVAIIENRQRELCPVGLLSRNRVYGRDRDVFDAYQEDIDAIENLPTADVLPVVCGHWIGIDDFPHEIWECDQCGCIVEDEYEPWQNFCPICGAKMRG